MGHYYLDKERDRTFGDQGKLIAEDQGAAEACAARLEQMHVDIGEMEKQIGSFFDRGADGQRDRGKLEAQFSTLKWALWEVALALSIHYDYELPLYAAREAADAAEEAAKKAAEAEEAEAAE